MPLAWTLVVQPSWEQIPFAPCLVHNPLACALVVHPTVVHRPYAPCLMHTPLALMCDEHPSAPHTGCFKPCRFWVRGCDRMERCHRKAGGAVFMQL